MPLSLDEIRALAAQKVNYRPDLVGAQASAPSAGERLRSNRVQELVAQRPTIGGQVGSGQNILSKSGIDWSNPAPPSSGGGGFNPLGTLGSAVASGFTTVVDVYDHMRRAYQATAGELGDVVSNIDNPMLKFAANAAVGNPFQLRSFADEDGNRDSSFNPTQILKDTFDDEGISKGFMGRSTWDDSAPGFARPVIGFAGDILTDPGTYLTFGTGAVVSNSAKTGVRGAGGAVRALSPARKTMAADLAEQFMERGVKSLTKTQADDLVRAAGTRGKGAFTNRSLKKLGITAEDLAKEGIERQFGTTFGPVRLPGTAKAAMTAEDFKGAVKKAWGGSDAAKLGGELFRSARHGEREFARSILSGATDAPKAARELAILRRSQMDARGFAGRRIEESGKIVGSDGRKLKNLTADEAKQLTKAIDTGSMDHPLAVEFADFFQQVGRELQDEFGVPFNMRQNYVPHRLTDKARAALDTGDEQVRAFLDPTIPKESRFQKARWSDASIEEINAKWRKDNHDYDLMETDFKKLLTSYMEEAADSALRGRMQGELAERAGLVRSQSKTLDNAAVDADIDKLAAEELAQVKKTVASRRQAVNKAKTVAKRAKNDSQEHILKTRQAADDAQALLGKRQDDLVQAQKELKTAQDALPALERAAKKAQGADKSRLSNKIKQAEKQVAESINKIEDMEELLARSERGWAKQVDEIAAAEKDLAEKTAVYDAAEADRLRVESEPVSSDGFRTQEALQDAKVDAELRSQAVSDATDDVEVASNTVGWLEAEANQISDVMGRRMSDIMEWQQRIGVGASKEADAAKGTAAAAKQETADFLLKRMDEIRSEILQTPVDDKARRAFIRLEAQGAAADAAALTARKEGDRLKSLQTDFNNGLKAIDDPDFQKYVIDQIDDGYRLLQRNGVDMQIDAAYQDAVHRMEKFIDPSTRGAAFQQFHKFAKWYQQKFLNTWKGYAVGSPGFVVRNIYSGMFNMYLDGVPRRNVAKYMRFHKATQGMSDDAALAWAARNGFSDPELLVEAKKISAATGGGQTASEFGEKLSAKTTWLKPGSQWAPLRAARKGGEWGEIGLRGGHAYGVLQRGGSPIEALDRVTKFHFNYTDISEFDQVMKTVMPFWMFFSRNIGLQASVWTKAPKKISQSYYNLKRNMEEMEGTDFGVPIPDYIPRSMAGIATPFAVGDDQQFLTPDIPSIRFPDQMAQMADNPVRELMSSSGPLPKVPYQLMTGANAFLGNEYKDSLLTYGPDGELTRRKAPAWAQIPGADRVLGLLPGAEYRDNNLYMTDRLEDTLSEINPITSRVEGATGDRKLQSALSFLGVPIRINDDRAQAGAAAALERQQAERAYAIQSRLRFEGLTE